MPCLLLPIKARYIIWASMLLFFHLLGSTSVFLFMRTLRSTDPCHHISAVVSQGGLRLRSSGCPWRYRAGAAPLSLLHPSCQVVCFRFVLCKSSLWMSRHSLSRSARCMLRPLPSSRLSGFGLRKKSRFLPVLGKSCGCDTPACCGLDCSWPCSFLPIPSTDEIQVGALRKGHPAVLAARHVKRAGFSGSPPAKRWDVHMLSSLEHWHLVLLQYQLETGHWSCKTLAQMNKCC